MAQTATTAIRIRMCHLTGSYISSLIMHLLIRIGSEDRLQVERSEFLEGVEVDGREVGAEELAGPPGASLAFLFGSRVAIAIEKGTDKGRRRVRERVRTHKVQDCAVVGEQALDE